MKDRAEGEGVGGRGKWKPTLISTRIDGGSSVDVVHFRRHPLRISPQATPKVKRLQSTDVDDSELIQLIRPVKPIIFPSLLWFASSSIIRIGNERIRHGRLGAGRRLTRVCTSTRDVSAGQVIDSLRRAMARPIGGRSPANPPPSPAIPRHLLMDSSKMNVYGPLR